jgi:hypothetical protein
VVLVSAVAIFGQPAAALAVTNETLKVAVDAVSASVYVTPYLVIVLAAILFGLALVRRAKR